MDTLVRRLKIFSLAVWHFCLFLLRNLLVSAAVLSVLMLVFPSQFQAGMSIFRPIPEWVHKKRISIQELHPVVGEHERMKTAALAELGVAESFETVDSRQDDQKGDEVERLREEIRELRRQVNFLSQYTRVPSAVSEQKPRGWLQSMICGKSTDSAKF